MLDLALGFDLLVAALVGMAVGLEREWSGHTAGPDARFGGLRTFALLGTLGGISGWLGRLDMTAIATVLLGGGVVFVILAYVSAMRRPGTTADSTTEVAALLVLALGAVAGLGHRTIASAAGVLMIVVLAEKTSLQRALQRIDAHELRATLQFAVMALVILPLLPSGAFGPFDAFRPRQLWTVVLLFSALNFAGYIARRIVGETRGLGITGLLGGLVSSTAVTFNFSRRSREEPALSTPLAFGVVAACTVLLPRVVIIASALQRTLFLELMWLLGPVFAVGALVMVAALWREREARPVTPHQSKTAVAPEVSRDDQTKTSNPLALGTSLQMAVAFQVVLFLIAWVHSTVGNPGVLASAALLGLTDMDALTLSMSRLAADVSQTHTAALAIGIGVFANTILKSIVAITLGETRFRWRAAAALLCMAASGAAALWWRW